MTLLDGMAVSRGGYGPPGWAPSGGLVEMD